MKNLIWISLFVVSNLFAQDKGTALSAAGTMITGGLAVKSYFSVRDLEESNYRPAVLAKIAQGDQVKITYAYSREDVNRARIIEDVQKTLDEREDELFKKIEQKSNGKNISQSRINALDNETMLLEKEIKLAKRELPKSVIKVSNPALIQAEIARLESKGAVITGFEVIKRSQAVKLARISRNGVVLASAAAAMGLITYEEYTSGKLKKKRNREWQALQGK